MGSITRFTEVPGNLFDAGVALPTPSPATTPPSEQPPDLILRELVELSARITGDDRKHANELIARRVSLNKGCAELRTKILGQLEKDLANQWEQAKTNCRDMECEIANARGRITELQREINRINEIALGPALVQRQTAQNEKASVSRFAPAKEVQKLDAAITKANVEVEKAQKEVAIVQQEINDIIHVTLPRLGEKFQKLSTEEKRICGMVTGQVFADETTGLPMLPEL